MPHISHWQSIVIIALAIVFLASMLVMFCNLYLSSRRMDEQDAEAIMMVVKKRAWPDNNRFKRIVDELKNSMEREI